MSEVIVAAVVVTYNRSSLLKKTLDAISNQTIKPNKIYVINNASTDNTIEVCEEFAKKVNGCDFLLINKNINDGGAGGFASGLDIFIDNKDLDFCWLMDDDIEPTNNCLEELLKYKDFSGFIHPLRFYDNGDNHSWRQVYMPSLGHTISLHYSGEYRTFGTNVGCFEGCLISREIVEKIGVPFRDFFISEDDTLYGFLASFVTPVIYVADAKIKRLIFPGKNIATWKYFYSIRNKIWMFRIILKKRYINKSNIIYGFFGISTFILWLLLKSRFKGSLEILKGVYHGINKNPEAINN